MDSKNSKICNHCHQPCHCTDQPESLIIQLPVGAWERVADMTSDIDFGWPSTNER